MLNSSTGSYSLSCLSQLTFDPLGSALMQLIASILTCLAKHNPSLISSEASLERMSSSGDAFMNRVNDIIR